MAAVESDKQAGGLGRWDAVAIIVGIIIGSSIYESPPDIFRAAGGPGWALAVWALVGLLSLVGALCYAELATTYPTSGGDYTYISQAFGRWFGFFFAWCELVIIRTGGSIAIMAYVFARYAVEFLQVDPKTVPYGVFAAGSVVAVTAINVLGMKPGKWTQNVLTLVKVLGLGGVIVAGLWLYSQGSAAEPVEAQPARVYETFALAWVFVFYAYGGWNETAYVAAEMRNKRRDIVLALIIGTLLVTLIYVAINTAFLMGLGYGGATRSEAIASDLVKLALGDVGGQLMALLVVISALGAINGLLFTGVRLYRTFGNDHPLFAALGRENKSGVGFNSLVTQAALSLAIIGIIETAPSWRPMLGNALSAVGITGVVEVNTQVEGFRTLVIATGPVFWTFFLLSGLAYFVLRDRDQHLERPFKLTHPWYPLLPAAFVGSSVFMLYQSGTYALSQKPAEAIFLAAVILLSVPLYLVSNSLRSRRAPTINQ